MLGVTVRRGIAATGSPFCMRQPTIPTMASILNNFAQTFNGSAINTKVVSTLTLATPTVLQNAVWLQADGLVSLSFYGGDPVSRVAHLLGSPTQFMPMLVCQSRGPCPASVFGTP